MVFAVLLLILTSVVIVSYASHLDQEHMQETTKRLVTNAVSFIEQEGKTAFPEFRKEGSEWFHGDSYVFVWRTDGLRVVYPPDPSGEGQNMSSLVDANGKPIGKLFIDTALSAEGEGWVDYSWPKPHETEPSIKRTFIKSVIVEKETFLVGSGYYIEVAQSVVKPLQYVAIALESAVALMGLLLAIRKKRFFGYGIFLTFAIYVFYDLARLIPLNLSDTALYPIFFIATLSIFWAIILLYREKNPKSG
ncbi:MAG: cache domain-containing protein [Candidatus Bathyarchaeota archaeon]|nr:cache domain-containing protein [Candidatus Bathyarchaeota archaeon]